MRIGKADDMITTVIFDMDGTVLNTLEDLAFSVNNVLSRFGMPVHRTEDYRPLSTSPSENAKAYGGSPRRIR